MKEVHKSWQLFFFFCWYSISFLSERRVQFERELAVHGELRESKHQRHADSRSDSQILNRTTPKKETKNNKILFTHLFIFVSSTDPGAQVRLTPSLCHANVLLSLFICTMSRHLASFSLEPLVTVNRLSSLEDRMRHQGSFSVAKQTQPPQKPTSGQRISNARTGNFVGRIDEENSNENCEGKIHKLKEPGP